MGIDPSMYSLFETIILIPLLCMLDIVVFFPGLIKRIVSGRMKLVDYQLKLIRIYVLSAVILCSVLFAFTDFFSQGG
ncbi:hypothetical protein MALU111345_03780 [Marinicrinis lubricantis]